MGDNGPVGDNGLWYGCASTTIGFLALDLPEAYADRVFLSGMAVIASTADAGVGSPLSLSTATTICFLVAEAGLLIPMKRVDGSALSVLTTVFAGVPGDDGDDLDVDISRGDTLSLVGREDPGVDPALRGDGETERRPELFGVSSLGMDSSEGIPPFGCCIRVLLLSRLFLPKRSPPLQLAGGVGERDSGSTKYESGLSDPRFE